MAEKRKFSIKSDFTMLALLLIPIAVAVNFVGGQIASGLKLPFYLDTIGTILVAMLCGPWVGAVAGLVTNLVMGIANPIYIPFAIVNVAVGLVTGFCARKGGFTLLGGIASYWWKWLISIVLMAAVSIITAAPLVVIMFGGMTGSGTSLITAALVATGQNIWTAFISTELIFTVLDRIISIFFTIIIIKVIPSRMLIKFSLSEFYVQQEADGPEDSDDAEDDDD